MAFNSFESYKTCHIKKFFSVFLLARLRLRSAIFYSSNIPLQWQPPQLQPQPRKENNMKHAWLHSTLTVLVVLAGLKYAKAGTFGTTIQSLANTIS